MFEGAQSAICHFQSPTTRCLYAVYMYMHRPTRIWSYFTYIMPNVSNLLKVLDHILRFEFIPNLTVVYWYKDYYILLQVPIGFFNTYVFITWVLTMSSDA